MRSEILKAAVQAAHEAEAEAIEKAGLRPRGGSAKASRRMGRAALLAQVPARMASAVGDAAYYSPYKVGMLARTLPSGLNQRVLAGALKAMDKTYGRVGRLETARDYLASRAKRKK